MFPSNIQEKAFKKRLSIFLGTTALFIGGFVVNVVINKAAYNANLNFIPNIQNSSFWGNGFFVDCMNIISNIFNPIICAGYILVFLLISYRKL